MATVEKQVPAEKGRERSRRQHARRAARIPVQVQVVHAWKGVAGTPLSGIVLDISRGGAALRLDRVLPPRTRLRVVMATAIPGLTIVADVVWTPLGPGRGASGRLYGLRWQQPLSEAQFTALLPLLAVPERDRQKPAAPVTAERAD